MRRETSDDADASIREDGPGTKVTSAPEPSYNRCVLGRVVNIAAALTLSLTASCSKTFGAPGNFDDPIEDPKTDAGTAPSATPDAAATPLRRLTRAQYVNSVRDALPGIVPDDSTWSAQLPLDVQAAGFAANTAAVTDTIVEQYERVAEAIAASASPTGALTCLNEAPTAECIATAVETLGPRLFRRPLTESERDDLIAVATAPGGLPPLLTALLTSPQFLYRAEPGTPVPNAADRIALTQDAIATRMAYLLWGTTPDDELRALATDGQLTDSDVREAQVWRMLDDVRARQGLAQMHVQWLELQALSNVVKDRNVYPGFTEAIGPFMLAEVASIVDDVVRHGDGSLHTLLTTRRTIAALGVRLWYGDDATVELDEPPSSAPVDADVLTLDPEHRAGILTSVSVLAAHAKPDRSDPVRRGMMIRRRLLCQPLAAAPPDIPAAPAGSIPGESVRDQLDRHRDDPTCAVCHDLTDPIGYTLERYDAMGRYRTEDPAANAIDSTGTIIDADIDGVLNDGVELAVALAQSAQVQRCYATQWFRYAFGRQEQPDDADALQALHSEFAASDGHIPSLLVALVTSDAFVHRRLQ